MSAKRYPNSTGSQSVTRYTKNARVFWRIVRHGAGPSAIYIITYHKLEAQGALPKPAMAEGAQALIDLLEKIGVDFRMGEVRGALEDILRLARRIFRICG